ncbi:MAG: 1,4-alpha-glucan branching protein GlgB [Tissierellia bacterium]|nr:1,4-alpha-glucan branching protein GlgB [Tissierellia bacterium]
MNYSYRPIDPQAAYFFNQGKSSTAYEFLGPHREEGGITFTVWAPHALAVEWVGDANDWGREVLPMAGPQYECYTITLPPEVRGRYKYKIHTEAGAQLKADPFAFTGELIPQTASVVLPLEDIGRDHAPYKNDSRLNIYEVHLSSWRRREYWRYPQFNELAEDLLDYVKDMGYTHVELLPITEHPYDGSWGYQATGYFAVTSRYGSPQDFMNFVKTAHEKGIGVILDWVPGHFAKDAHGLRYFDGTATFESPDPEGAENPVWDTMAFDLSRPQVRSFLLSSAAFFARVYDIDGIRVDAVSYLIYKNFGRGEVDTKDPQNFRQEAISFLRELTEVLHQIPDFLVIAEESEDFSGITWPHGLGFDYKWDMGWMHHLLAYMALDPVHRSHHHDDLTFPLWYSFHEHYILPLSHDEVVHLKKSLLDKMHGDGSAKFQQLKLLYAYMMAHPGKKLLFMGGELGQWREWSEERTLDWHLLEYESHRDLKEFVRSLNHCYLSHSALSGPLWAFEGFQWLLVDRREDSVVAFFRKSAGENILCIFNFTPVHRKNYQFTLPEEGEYECIFNTSGTEPNVTIREREVTLDLGPFQGLYFLERSQQWNEK